MQNFYNISLIFTGTVIGAGFASGQEIMQYFLKYGNAGVFGIFLSIVVFSLLVCIIMCKIQCTGAGNPDEYLSGCPRFVKISYSVITTGFMLVSFCVMVIASGEMFFEHAGLPRFFGIFLMLSVSIYCFFRGSNGIVIINKLMTPAIIIVTVIVFADKMLFSSAPVFKAAAVCKPAVSAFVYVSYNTLSLISVMTAVGDYITDKGTAVLSSVFGGIMLLVTALCIWCVMRGADVQNAEIPMLAAISPYLKPLYIPVLFFAMATTAVSNGAGVINSVRFKKLPVICVMTACSLVAARFAGFSVLVAKGYAFFGYAGFIIGAYTIADGAKYLKLRNNAKNGEFRRKSEKNRANP